MPSSSCPPVSTLPVGWWNGARWKWPVLSLALILSSCTQAPAPTQPASPSPPLLHASADSDAADPGSAAPPELAATALGQQQLPPEPIHEPGPLLPTALYPDQAPAPFVELGAMDSLPGEDLDGFLVRVSQAIDAFTAKTSHEACGVLMAHVQEEAWRVRLTTNRSHISCTLILFYEPGFERLGPDIHSHPFLPDGAFANAQDVLRNPRFTCGQHIRVFDERFSTQDLDRGPGYLVSRGRLLYQDGETFLAKEIATFERLEETPELTLSPGLAWGGVGTQAAAAAAWANEDTQDIPESWFPMTLCEQGPVGHPESASSLQEL